MPADKEMTLYDRIVEATTMGQQPKDRLWAAIAVLIIVASISGLVTVLYSESTRNYLETSREIDFQRGAVDCLTIIVDNDRYFALPTYCSRSEVRAHFPPEVCEQFFARENDCGRYWVDS